MGCRVGRRNGSATTGIRDGVQLGVHATLGLAPSRDVALQYPPDKMLQARYAVEHKTPPSPPFGTQYPLGLNADPVNVHVNTRIAKLGVSNQTEFAIWY